MRSRAYILYDILRFTIRKGYSRKRIYIVGTKNKKIDLTFDKEQVVLFGDIQETGLPIVKSEFTDKLLKKYRTDELYGKSLKDKRGGKNNIHSWDIGLKGKINSEQRILLDKILTERRKKKYAKEIGIRWCDGLPLAEKQIKSFYNADNLKEMLADLVNKGYLRLEHPKKKVDGRKVESSYLEKGYNIVSGKLSYQFSNFLDPNQVTPTMVATDMNRIGVVDGYGVRKISLIEGLRLFGYPDDYPLGLINIRNAYDLLGNTMSVNVIERISYRIINEIYK